VVIKKATKKEPIRKEGIKKEATRKPMTKRELPAVEAVLEELLIAAEEEPEVKERALKVTSAVALVEDLVVVAEVAEEEDAADVEKAANLMPGFL
jgi:hypothetical protein